MIENLKQAREYAKKIDNGEIKNPLLNNEFQHALKELAKAKDEQNFRKIVDFVADKIKKDKKGGSSKFYNTYNEALALLECLIMQVDHGNRSDYILFQLSRGMDVKRPALRKTQRFFQKLYGSHFFVD
ncbi:MAG: hypothetical protein ABEI74_02440 [Candidatus Pacearchaeota archaeon]